MSLLLDNPALLAAFREGSRGALEQVYRAYVTDVATLVRRGFTYDKTKVVSVAGVSDESRQAELIQETFVRAFSDTGRRNYDGRSPFRPYLLRIAKNLMIDVHRRSGRTVSLEDLGRSVGDIEDLIAGDHPLPPESGAELAHWQRQQDVVRELTRALSGEERSFYELRYEAGLAQEDVAERLGCTRRRVRTLEARLRKMLLRLLVERDLWP